MKKKTKKKVKKESPIPSGIVYQKLLDYIVMVYGAPGVGKTSFVHSLSERILFISTDRGTRFLPIPSDCRREVDCWEDVLAAVKELRLHPGKYDAICIDHVDDVAFFAEEFICQKYDIESADELGHGKYWRDLKNHWKKLVHSIKSTGLGLIFIAHDDSKEIKLRGRKIMKTMPLIGKTTWKVILPLVDLLGHAFIEYDAKLKRELRMLQTQPSDSVTAKDRTTRRKPKDGYEILDSQSFMKTFIGVQANGKKEEISKKKVVKKVRGKRARARS
jgi:phage nucleotide-binding protein